LRVNESTDRKIFQTQLQQTSLTTNLHQLSRIAEISRTIELPEGSFVKQGNSNGVALQSQQHQPMEATL